MPSITNKFKVLPLRARLALRQSACVSLAKQYESASLTVGQKDALGQRWENALNDSLLLQFMLQLLENLRPS